MAAPLRRRCLSCGSPVFVNDRICGYCGEDPAVIPTPNPWIFLTMTVGLGIIVAVGLWCWA